MAGRSHETIAPAQLSARSRGDTGEFVREVCFSTAGLPRDEQFPIWRDLMSDFAEVDCLDDAPRENGYLFEAKTYDLGKLNVSMWRSDGSTFRRGMDRVKRGGMDHWILCCRPGGRYVSQSGRRGLDAQAGSLWLASLAYPFEGWAESGSTCCLYIERDQLLSVAGQLDRLNHCVLDGINARIAVEFLQSMSRLLPTTSVSEIPIFVETALIIIQGFIEQADPLDVNPTRPIMAVRLETVKRYIQENLTSNSLEPDDICVAMRLSRRQLYYLFEELGGVSAYVRSRRLMAIHEAIADPAESRPMHSIAADFGFHDAALFSRQFKAEFGYSPKDARAAKLIGYSHPPMPSQRYAEWLVQART